MFIGSSKSVSRVPGAAPRTSTPPTAPLSTSTTVQPVGRSESVKCPTLMPGIAVSPSAWRAEAVGTAATVLSAMSPAILPTENVARNDR